jgi:hypothetical protein
LIVESLATYIASFALAFLCGYGPVRLLLPVDLRAHRVFLMPTTGFMLFCWLTFWLSASFDISPASVVWPVFAMLCLLGVVSHPLISPDERFSETARTVGLACVLTVPTLLVTLWPLFYIGADTYLGNINPDYFASLRDLHFFLDSSVADRGTGADTYHSFWSDAGKSSPSARFSSVLFAYLIQQTLQVSLREALTLAIAVFIGCLPLTAFSLSRALFPAGRALSVAAAVLTSIAAPTTMSYLNFYVGQNSALSAVPLLLVVAYWLLLRPSWQLLLFSIVLVNALIVMYVAMLPYVAIPAAAVGVLLIIRRELPIRWIVRIVGGMLIGLLVINVWQWRFLFTSLVAWRNVTTPSTSDQIFGDFLTEAFVPLFLGLTIYPVGATWLLRWVGSEHYPLVVWLSIALVASLVVLGLVMWRSAKVSREMALVTALIGAYLITWVYYTFVHPFGYAMFKLTSWAQIALALSVACTATVGWRRLRGSHRTFRSTILSAGMLAITAVVVVPTVTASLQYGFAGSAPGNVETLVNVRHVSGNQDYLELQDSLRGHVSPESESIGLVFSDFIQNEWISYYLRDYRTSILSHNLFQGTDETFEDVPDSAAFDSNPYWHGASDDYYLLPTDQNPNQDIVSRSLPEPVWKNGSFQLLRASEVQDLLVTGRGYYRVESSPEGLSYWWPRHFRWIREGAELILIRPARIGEPYRLSFAVIAGPGGEYRHRTLELWHEGGQFDEINVTGSARVVSKPFYPSGGVDRIVVRVRDPVISLPRGFQLWNREIPLDVRRLNVALAEVQVTHDVASLAAPPGADFTPLQMLRSSVEFNGFEPDGWVGSRATFSISRPPESRFINMDLTVPDVSDRVYPYSIEVHVDGAGHQVNVLTPGSVPLRYPLQPHSEDGITEVLLQPSQPREIVGPFGRNRGYQTVHLSSVRFEASGEAGSDNYRFRGATVNGVASDGWFARRAELQIDPSSDWRVLAVELEYPEWSGVKTFTTRLSEGQRVATSSSVIPGMHVERLILSPSSLGQTVVLEVEEEFSLPSPDSRVVSAMIRSADMSPLSMDPSAVVSEHAGSGLPSPTLASSVQWQGIESDGWMKDLATLTVEPHGATRTLSVEVECPEWSGVQRFGISVSHGSETLLATIASPGFHVLQMALPPSSQTKTLSLRADSEFSLPAPDHRSVSLRIVRSNLEPR